MPFKKAYYSDNQYAPKHITVDLGGQAAVKTGNFLSSRQVIVIKDETGKKKKGFFTPDEFINEKELFSGRADDIEELKQRPGLDVIRKKIAENESTLSDFIFVLCVEAKKHDKKLALNTEVIKQKDFDLRNKLSDASLHAVGVFLKERLKLDDGVFGDLSKDPIAVSYLNTVLIKAVSIMDKMEHTTQTALQSRNTNINRRNNAMYSSAELLDKEYVLAKSVFMTVKNGDKTINGTFMENAEGIPLEDFSPSAENFERKPLRISGGCIKDASALQIMDYLCGNIDRHAKNMFYKVDTSGDSVKIVGLQGIDNDDSFGRFGGEQVKNQKVIYEMSGLYDIKIMDADMAQKILALTPERYEAKIRQSGLSASEVKAANERLVLLQNRIKNNDIELIKDNAGWEKYASPNKLEKLATIERGNWNIFSLLKRIPEEYNTFLQNNPNSANGPWTKDPSGNKEAVPEAVIINTDESYPLNDHLEKLGEYESALGIREDHSIPKELGEFGKQYLETMDMLREALAQRAANLSLKKTQNEAKRSEEPKVPSKVNYFTGDSEMLSYEGRNLLSESLKDLADEADRYAQTHESPENAPALVNAVKNIKAYANYAREQLQHDALEAEMNFISLQAEKIRQENKLPEVMDIPKHRAPVSGKTSVTYNDLLNDMKAIEGRSSDTFKNMINTFRRTGNPKTANNIIEMQLMYNSLIDAAQKYLQYKIPDNNTARLKEKEKKRVQFAKDLTEFSKAGLANVKKDAAAAQKKKAAAKEKKDYLRISDFHAFCDKLVNDYNHASTPLKKEECKAAILAAKTKFAEEYRNIVDTSSRYPKQHDMQTVCGVMLTKGSIKEFEKIYFDCAAAADPNDKSDVFHRLGIEKEYADRAKEIEKIGRNAFEATTGSGSSEVSEKLSEITVKK